MLWYACALPLGEKSMRSIWCSHLERKRIHVRSNSGGYNRGAEIEWHPFRNTNPHPHSETCSREKKHWPQGNGIVKIK